jgi:hypothetical protein
VSDIQTDTQQITLGNADAYKATQAKANKMRTDSLNKAQKQATKGKAKKAADKQPAKMGRPSIYSEELKTRICELLANGTTLSEICKRPDMPSFDTIWSWRRARADFSEEVAYAQRIGTHYLADDCIRIADDDSIDPAHKRVMVDVRMRLIGKWNQYYSDKQQVEVSGKIDVAPVDVHQLDYDQREALAGMLEQIALPSPDQDDEL